MARGIDRLRSLLPDTELILNARESFMNVQGHYNFYNQALKKKQFGKFLNFFEKEIEAIDDTALKIKRIKLRFLANLNSVELELNTYRKQYKTASKKNPAAKQQIHVIESLLEKIKNIKKHVKNEIGKSTYDERNLHGSV